MLCSAPVQPHGDAFWKVLSPEVPEAPPSPTPGAPTLELGSCFLRVAWGSGSCAGGKLSAQEGTRVFMPNHSGSLVSQDPLPHGNLLHATELHT